MNHLYKVGLLSFFLLYITSYNFCFEENFKFFIPNHLNKNYFSINYIQKPFDIQVFLTDYRIGNFFGGFYYRNFDNIEIVDENKNILSSISLYDTYLGVGYEIPIYEEYFVDLMLDLKYDYYYFNYELTLGGMVGALKRSKFINYYLLLGNLEKEFYICFLFDWEIYKDTFNLKTGTLLGINQQGFLISVNTTILNYSVFRLELETGGMYFTLKGFLPEFSVKIVYGNFSFRYGLIVQDIVGISQFLSVEFR